MGSKDSEWVFVQTTLTGFDLCFLPPLFSLLVRSDARQNGERDVGLFEGLFLQNAAPAERGRQHGNV